ncbi:MAG TPA: hypothetical protein VFP80_16465, partial [Thermoanaerobaculia bacterium]|nr:hypothetical protein [Thermoanaerobaculia bacterium]
MKILCVADERRVAQAAADALRGIAPNVTLTWAEALSPALHWVQHNRDAAAVIVEAEVRGQSCRPLVDHVRGLGLTTPIVVVVPEHFRPPLPYFGTDDVVFDESLPESLPPVITRALQRTQPAGSVSDIPSPPPTVGRFGRPGAGVEHPDERGAVEARVPNAAAAQAEELAQRLAQEMARRAALEQDLATVESARRCAEQRHAGELAEAAARHADERAQHERALTRNTRICTALQEKLLELEAAVRHADERRAFEAARFAGEEAQREKALARTARVCAALQERLLELEAALRNAEEQRVSQAAAAAEHLAQRHAEFTASLKHAAQSRDSLAQRLSVTMAALEEAR